jgi:hypothetical protein
MGGLLVFFVGAAFWRPAEFQAPLLSEVLRHVAARHTTWLWIHAWMAAGVLITLAGLTTFIELQRLTGERLATPIGVAVFATGALLWLVAMAVRVTVQDFAATQALTGGVPEFYPPIHRLVGVLHAAHMVLSYVAAVALGLGVLRSGILPASWGWVGVGGGAVFALAYGGFHVGLLGMPFLALVYPFALGVLILRAGNPAGWGGG